MSLYKQKGSEVWWTNFSHAGRRVRLSTGTTDRSKATKRERELQVETWAKVPDVKGATWGNAVVAWCEVEERSESELLSLAKFGRRYPDRALSEVTRDNVHEALSFCRTAGTYMRYRTMIAAILNLAKTAGWIAAVPMLATRKDKKTKPRDWLTHDQWDALYAELPKHMKLWALFAVETGLRQENVLGLEWKRVSLERRMVWIEAEDMKADEALTVPLSDTALAILTMLPQEGQYVFTLRGKRVKEIKTAFMAACVRAGLGRQVKGEDGKTHYDGFTWHGLRHTWATWHAQHGTPMEVLQKLGGWADPRMVQRYAHHSPGFVAGFVNNTRKSE